MIETWAPISLFPQYEISDQGNVRNCLTGKLLRPFNGYGKDGQHYKKICLYKKGERFCFFVHRLVAFAFYEVDHRNRVRNDNRLSNLEPVLRCENDARWRKEEIPF